MKDYEKRLLDHLQNDNPPDVPLAEVRQAMGHIGQTVGNPLSKTEIALSITSYIWSVGVGAIILPAALPANLQTTVPVCLFGLTDMHGGYLRSFQINPFPGGWQLAAAVVPVGIVNFNAVNLPGWAFGFVQPGDMTFTYVDATGLFNIIVVIHCSNVAYGTFLNSFVSDLITISHIRYFVPNINQFVNPIIFGYQTLFGKVSTDSIDPRLYILGKDPQQAICDIPVNLPIDKNLMIGLQMSVFCQTINWILFVEKVEALTHERKNKK